MRDPIGSREATKRAAEIINAAAIYGQKASPGKLLEEAQSIISSGLTVTYERSWGVDTHLHLRFHPDTSKKAREGAVIPDIELSWSSSHRDPVSVTACLALYEEVNKLACLLLVVLGRETILDDSR